jgi:hypothetical protein
VRRALRGIGWTVAVGLWLAAAWVNSIVEEI